VDASYSVRLLPLPPAAQGGITMDYIAFDPATRFVWVPAGNTGAVDVVDTATGKVTQISGVSELSRRRIRCPAGHR
jgi:DNA-binding beta-propeller fold protein YncE